MLRSWDRGVLTSWGPEVLGRSWDAMSGGRARCPAASSVGGHLQRAGGGGAPGSHQPPSPGRPARPGESAPFPVSHRKSLEHPRSGNGGLGGATRANTSSAAPQMAGGRMWARKACTHSSRGWAKATYGAAALSTLAGAYAMQVSRLVVRSTPMPLHCSHCFPSGSDCRTPCRLMLASEDNTSPVRDENAHAPPGLWASNLHCQMIAHRTEHRHGENAHTVPYMFIRNPRANCWSYRPEMSGRLPCT